MNKVVWALALLLALTLASFAYYHHWASNQAFKAFFLGQALGEASVLRIISWTLEDGDTARLRYIVCGAEQELNNSLDSNSDSIYLITSEPYINETIEASIEYKKREGVSNCEDHVAEFTTDA